MLGGVLCPSESPELTLGVVSPDPSPAPMPEAAPEPVPKAVVEPLSSSNCRALFVDFNHAVYPKGSWNRRTFLPSTPSFVAVVDKAEVPDTTDDDLDSGRDVDADDADAVVVTALLVVIW